MLFLQRKRTKKSSPGEQEAGSLILPAARGGRKAGRAVDGGRGVFWRGAVLAACGLLAVSASLSAKQRKAAIRVVSGVVMDQQDRPLLGAVVEMTDVQTGKGQAMYTQADGRYEFSGLNPDHDYHLQAKYKGLASEVRTASSFDTRDRIVLNLTVPPPKEN
jgi:Carboxypeptidase regulatory-like domain